MLSNTEWENSKKLFHLKKIPEKEIFNSKGKNNSFLFIQKAGSTELSI